MEAAKEGSSKMNCRTLLFILGPTGIHFGQSGHKVNLKRRESPNSLGMEFVVILYVRECVFHRAGA